MAGPSIRAADADIYDIGKADAARGFDFAIADSFRERFHFGPLGQDLRHDIVALSKHWPAGTVTQGHVQGRTVFRDINRLAREERRPARLDTCRAREIEKQLERCFGEPVFRIVEQDVVKLNVETREPTWVIAKEIRDCLPGHGSLMRVQSG